MVHNAHQSAGILNISFYRLSTNVTFLNQIEMNHQQWKFKSYLRIGLKSIFISFIKETLCLAWSLSDKGYYKHNSNRLKLNGACGTSGFLNADFVIIAV